MKVNGAFGRWIKQRRKALDLTQQDVADQVGCAVVTIRRIEGDVARPSKQIAERLADVLAVSPDERTAFIGLARKVTNKPPSLPIDSSSVQRAVNLPQQMTPFVGRAGELARLTERLSDPNCRLLTLVGPGGIGKTRLALEAAQQQSANFAHGVHFVSLAPVDSADLLIFAIGSTLGFSFYGQDVPAVQLRNYLREKLILLVLDNFEHLLDGTPLLLDLLADAPRLKLLITSRERLNMQGEWALQVEGMDYPQVGETVQLESYAAVQLFVQSAQRVQASFSLTADPHGVLCICQLLEGMPLGILLAAAWIGVLSVQEILQEIQQNLNFLETDQRDMPERQRSLRATIDYSWKLLTEDERDAFEKLSMFRGGFTRDAAQYITGASLKTLRALVNKSLLRREASSGRYEIHELLRQYGEEQLSVRPQQREHIRDVHCEYYAGYMQRQLTELMSPKQVAVLAEIGVEFNNLLRAWNSAVDKCRAGIFRAMALSLWYFCDLRAPPPESADLFRRAAEVLQGLPAEKETDIALGLMLALQSWFEIVSTALTHQAERLIEKSLTVLRQHDCPQETVFALVCLAENFAFMGGRSVQAEQAAREGLAIAREHHTQWGLVPCLFQLGDSLRARGDFAQAQQVLEECLNVGQASGDLYGIACAVDWLGGTAMDLGDYAEAEKLLEQALRRYEELEKGILPARTAGACSELGKLALLIGDYEKAKAWLQQSMDHFQKAREPNRHYFEALYTVSKLFGAQGQKQDAVQLLSVMQSQTSNPYIRDRVATSLAELQTALPDNIYAAAIERGRSLDLDIVVTEFLAT